MTFVKKILIKNSLESSLYTEYNTQVILKQVRFFLIMEITIKVLFDGDMPHGIGTLTYKDGSKVKGKWDLGNFAKNN